MKKYYKKVLEKSTNKFSLSELIVLVGKLPSWYKTIFVFILIFEDVIHHQFIMRVVRWVSVLLKLFLQVLFYLKSRQK